MFWVIAIGLVVLGVAVAVAIARWNGRRDPLPEKLTDDDIASAARSGDTTRALRWYRSVHGGGLKAAKEAVGKLARKE